MSCFRNIKKFLNPSSLSSVIRYFQSVGVTLSADFLSSPGRFQKFIDAIVGFFDKIYTYIPSIPDFDVRFNFVFASCILPIALDFLLQWTTSDDLVRNMFHVMDVFAAFVFLFHIGHVINAGDYYWGTFVFIIFGLLWCAYRVYLLWNKDKFVKPDLETMIEELRKYYMQGIIPEYTSDLDEEKIYIMCERYNSNIMLEEIEPSVLNISFIGIFFIVFLILVLLGFGVIPGMDIAPFFKVVIIIIGILFMLILIFVAIMIIVKPFRAVFISIRIAVKNFFLMLVLMCFDFIYIPVCKAFLELFYTSKVSCPAGQYLPIPTSYDNITASLSNLPFNLTCTPCTSTEGACSALCDGATRVYNAISPHLIITDDILETTGLAAVYGALAIVVGLPILWWYIIYINRKIIWSVPAFGRSREEKWNYITHNMKTSAINLFYMYRPSIARWNIVLMISKLFSVIIIMISELVQPKISYVLLIGYLALFAANWIFQPYMIQFNNALDSLVAFANALLTIVTICAAYGKQIPDSFSIPLSIAICVMPIFSVIYILIFKPKSVAGEIYDPFACYDSDGNKIEGIIEDDEIEVASIHFMTMWQLEALISFKISDDMSNYDLNIYSNNRIDHGDDDEFIKVRADLLKERLDEMEKRIDQICDATSSDQMLNIINIASIFAALASGYFFGAVYGRYMAGTGTGCSA